MGARDKCQGRPPCLGRYAPRPALESRPGPWRDSAGMLGARPGAQTSLREHREQTRAPDGGTGEGGPRDGMGALCDHVHAWRSRLPQIRGERPQAEGARALREDHPGSAVSELGSTAAHHRRRRCDGGEGCRSVGIKRNGYDEAWLRLESVLAQQYSESEHPPPAAATSGSPAQQVGLDQELRAEETSRSSRGRDKGGRRGSWHAEAPFAGAYDREKVWASQPVLESDWGSESGR
mmetsp:Transcript_15793/g.60119  ORF Transcript_15793/g.60119 Transcript_15793/m.60119 type:complete len:235 (-) Transcript_15793:2398-3102(-)